MEEVGYAPVSLSHAHPPASVHPCCLPFEKQGVSNLIIIGLAACFVWLPRTAAAQSDSTVFESSMYDDGSERYFQGAAEFPAGKAWQLERSLGVSEAAQWFPLATGYGSYLAPVYQPMLREPLDPANSRHGFKAKLQPFPLLPVPPRPSSVGLGPRPQYLFAHASLRFRDLDGAVTGFGSIRMMPALLPSLQRPEFLVLIWTASWVGLPQLQSK